MLRVDAPASPLRAGLRPLPDRAGRRPRARRRRGGLVDRRPAAVAAAADDAGVRLGLEPIHASQRDALTLITTIPETLELLDEAGLPDVGIMVDLWHLWDTPEIDRHLTENVDRITGVHVADWYGDGRDDRALPGEGVARIGELMRVLRDAGWRGAWDVEIFGDPGRPDVVLGARRRRGRPPRARGDRGVSSARAAGRSARARSRRTPSSRRRPRARARPSHPGTRRRAPAAGRRRSA